MSYGSGRCVLKFKALISYMGWQSCFHGGNHVASPAGDATGKSQNVTGIFTLGQYQDYMHKNSLMYIDPIISDTRTDF